MDAGVWRALFFVLLVGVLASLLEMTTIQAVFTIGLAGAGILLGHYNNNERRNNNG